MFVLDKLELPDKKFSSVYLDVYGNNKK